MKYVIIVLASDNFISCLVLGLCFLSYGVKQRSLFYVYIRDYSVFSALEICNYSGNTNTVNKGLYLLNEK